MIGRTLGPYRIDASLGSGGMGEVFRAHDTRLHRDVAIKIVRGDRDESAERHARLLREARALSAVSHPNVATVFDVGREGDLDFIVLERVPGETLAQRLARGPLPERDVLRLGAQLAAGLAAAHAHGIVHRDLKPSNLMLTPDGTLKILDFGLAHWFQAPSERTFTTLAHASGAISGTLPYMAPEQLRDEPADARTDVYGAGCVLYEMATGRRPFTADSAHALMYAILHTDPPRPRTLAPGIGPGLESAILAAMARDPSHRVGSAEALGALLAGEAPPVDTARPRRATGGLLLVAAAGLAVVAAAILLVPRTGLFRGASSARSHTIAVLPLVNLSGDLGQEYFADGMTDELISELSRIDAIQVIARGSVMPYKGTRKPLRQVARELGVNTLLEGSVQRGDGRVRVTAELVEARTAHNLWSQSYEQPLEGVLALQDSMARTIAGAIRAHLTPGEVSRLSNAPAVDPRAHDEYLLGRYETGHATKEGWRSAVEHYRRALEIDPRFAPAQVGLAEVHYLMSSWFMPADSAMPQVRDAAQRAIELDESLGDAHAYAAVVAAQYDWDFTRAEREYQRSIELAPSGAAARLYYGYLLYELSRFDESREQLAAAQRLDPSNALARWLANYPDFLQRRYDVVERRLRASLEVDSTYAPAWSLLGETLEMEGRFDEATAVLDHGLALGGNLWLKAAKARILAKQGRRVAALAMVREIESASAHGDFCSPFALASVRAALGDTDRAFDLLERAARERDENVLLLASDPRIKPLRSDPRLAALIHRVGLDRPGTAPVAGLHGRATRRVASHSSVRGASAPGRASTRDGCPTPRSRRSCGGGSPPPSGRIATGGSSRRRPRARTGWRQRCRR